MEFLLRYYYWFQRFLDSKCPLFGPYLQVFLSAFLYHPIWQVRQKVTSFKAEFRPSLNLSFIRISEKSRFYTIFSEKLAEFWRKPEFWDYLSFASNAQKKPLLYIFLQNLPQPHSNRSSCLLMECLLLFKRKKKEHKKNFFLAFLRKFNSVIARVSIFTENIF